MERQERVAESTVLGDSKVPTKFEWNIAKLENIAEERCLCTEDSDDRCRMCIASGALNRITADAYGTMKELKAD